MDHHQTTKEHQSSLPYLLEECNLRTAHSLTGEMIDKVLVDWHGGRLPRVPQEVCQEGGALCQALQQRALPCQLGLKRQARRLSRRLEQRLGALGSQCQDSASACISLSRH